MRNFFYSRSMLVILIFLLMLVFFLPDFIGPIPSLLIGALVIGLSFFVYNKWCGLSSENGSDDD
ncbi:MAG: hypothetical protein V2I35_11685, partial [Desulfocapsaceae bacterium]|nr:hypothetical protein [Desulfocapsaceae bacterium]